ncbi:serpin B10-like [Daktulosphaira vitifoliae]|uniref:serpin B10-like n=1 Tax=Daktulosphaira vitifoliae TaxID=58002 RepID=UPI0021AADF89|nr:serpin B10-like [Daktulosphaira vitifoliae]
MVDLYVENNLEALSLSNYAFSLKFYAEFRNYEDNIFYSPLNIHVLMFMASVGAAAGTFDEMFNLLHLSKNNTIELLDTYRRLYKHLEENHALKAANGIFIDKSFNVKQNYLDDTKKHLKIGFEELDFQGRPEEERLHINNWVENNTYGKIHNILAPNTVDQSTTMIMINALHFHSPWLYKFDEAKDEPFYITPTTTTNVKMMSLTANLGLYRNEAAKYSVIKIPYEKTNFNMFILLTDSKDGLKEVEANIHKVHLTDITKGMKMHNVNLKLPKFTIVTQTYDFKDILSKIGAPTMFTEKANFSEIATPSERPLFINKFIQKTHIDVTGDGSDNYRTNKNNLDLSNTTQYPSANFHVDHPIIFCVSGNNDNVIFAGRYIHP